MLVAAALLALVVLAGNGGNDGPNVGVSLRLSELVVGTALQEVREVEVSLDVATPDRLMCGLLRVPDIRVAGAGVVVETEFVRGRPSVVSTRIAAPPEGEIDGLFYISIYCALNDDTGNYDGFTASGIQVAEVDPETGFRMAACSGHWPFGTTFLVAERWPMVCRDRGSAVVTRTHLDAYFYDCGNQYDPAPGTGWAWLQATGTEALVEVLRQ